MANPLTEPESGKEPTAAPAPELPGIPDAQQLEAELNEALAKVAELEDKFLRAKAETENIRRRAEIEVANAHKYALERFAAEILAVRDSLEFARNVDLQQESAVAVQKMHEGLDLILKLLDGVFQKFGITLVDPQGERFDPEKHQALSMVESEEAPANHVMTVVQKGYLLNGRLLRPAMVVVAKPKPRE